jgi:hypothetical protein
MSTRVKIVVDARGTIAVKLATSAEEVAQLGYEATRLRRAAHPGVVGFLDHHAADEAHAELRTRYSGRSLEGWQGDLTRLAGLGAAVAATLADLHELGVVHGRIEPSHVLVGMDGRPRLCGFSALAPGDPADDVAGLGRLLAELAQRVGPDRRSTFAWRRGPVAERRTFEQLLVQATDPAPERRPSARAMAGALLVAVPDAELPPAGPWMPAPAAVLAQQGLHPRRHPTDHDPWDLGHDPNGRDPWGIDQQTAGDPPESGQPSADDQRDLGQESAGPDPWDLDTPAANDPGDVSRDPARADRWMIDQPGAHDPGLGQEPAGASRWAVGQEPTGADPWDLDQEPAAGSEGDEPGSRYFDDGLDVALGDSRDDDAVLEVFGDQSDTAEEELFVDRPWRIVPRPSPARPRHARPGAGARRTASRALAVTAGCALLAGLAYVLLQAPDRPTTVPTASEEPGSPESAADGADPGACPPASPGGAEPDAEAGGAGTGDATGTSGAAASAAADAETDHGGSDAGADTGSSGTGAGAETGSGEADVDGDGCGDVVEVADGVVHAGEQRWAVGEPGDVLAVGDWDCDGAATPAAYRPTTGDVFVFDTWAASGQPVAVEAAARVADGTTLAAERGDDGCDALVVATASGDRHTVEVDR